MKIVVGICGASGVIYGIRLLEILRQKGVETHLILSEWAKKTIVIETDYQVADVEVMASFCHDDRDLGATISSGSFRTAATVVIPCSMKTLSGIANGYGENLLIRAADVTLKEKRKLIIVPRETPLSAIHLENMLKLARLGVTVMPPEPAFYNRPQSIAQVVDHFLARVLDQLEIDQEISPAWSGMPNNPTTII